MNNFSPPPAAALPSFAAPSMATIGLTARESEIFVALQSAIIEQRLRPGMRLTEEELAAIFQASRMRIRRVLLALAHAGMIDLSPGRGAQVACPGPQEARSVFQARRLMESAQLEAEGARLAPGSMTTLRRLQHREDTAIHAHDSEAKIRLSGAFHVELARALGNPVMVDIIAGLVNRSSLIIALFQREGAAGCRLDDHATLLDALGAGAMQQAAALMRAHLDAIEAGLDVAIRPPPSGDLRSLIGVGHTDS